jgi:ribosomal protein L11 methylase PrmA
MTSEGSSFRDPSGFIFDKNGKLFRQVNTVYFPQFDRLIKSGLYSELVNDQLLIRHRIISKSPDKIIIRPEKIPFITYPYEWSFDMLKTAALLTLQIQKVAIEHGMILKDASAYNVQFIGTNPIFIDTLSFDIYREGQTWDAYKQFCQHFLAPLTLMSLKNLRLNLLLRDFIDGIPLELVSQLLPQSSRFNLSLLTHIHLHSINQRRMADRRVDVRKYQMSRFQMLSLISHLENTVKSLHIGKVRTEWEKYYTFTNYTDKASEDKHCLIERFLKISQAKSVLDLGANNGEFSKICAQNGAYTIACDIDPLAVNACYLDNQSNSRLLPLIIDLTNPSPALGWANLERSAFSDRFQVDLVLALALIHHLAISNNLPFEMIAGYFSKLGKYLLIEFVPKADSKVKILLQNRQDIFSDYSQKSFESAFSRFYKIIDRHQVKESKRIIYLMKRK